VKIRFSYFIPFLIGLTLSTILGFTVWKIFFFIFSYIGFCISLGQILEAKFKITDIGRRIAILMICPLFIVFFGLIQRENMQLEETVFYFTYFLSAGIFARVLIHYAIAKVFGPLIWGRGFCGWACWTAAILEWLPIKTNCKIPSKYTLFKIPVFAASILIPFFFIKSGYDYMQGHIIGSDLTIIQSAKFDQLILFLCGNAIYYAAAVILAFAFGKKRAFCKILCPVSLVMKFPSRFARIKKYPSGKKCIECGKCSASCPMDVDVMSYIRDGKAVTSTECILCGICSTVCPAEAIN